jgi:type III pantothenate kinase
LNLVLDIGNTRVKAALFEGDRIVELKYYTSQDEAWNDIDFIRQAKAAMIGSVVNDTGRLADKLSTLFPVHLFSSTTKIPLENLYQSASTLGSDRLAASIGAYTLYPNADVLVVDAGTCIKYNFTNAANQYLGGGISPGLAMRFKALHQFTGKLPLIEPDADMIELIGRDTRQSILSGVLAGSAAEVDGIIARYREQYPALIAVISGGDSEYLAKQLKSSIFTVQNLVLKGLNHSLNCTNPLP